MHWNYDAQIQMWYTHERGIQDMTLPLNEILGGYGYGYLVHPKKFYVWRWYFLFFEMVTKISLEKSEKYKSNRQKKSHSELTRYKRTIPKKKRKKRTEKKKKTTKINRRWFFISRTNFWIFKMFPNMQNCRY